MLQMLIRPTRRPAGPVLDSERGAFDLPSIITGVVTVGVLTAGVLASVFGVIPYAQDSAAKQDLAAINTAQAAARVKEGRFLDSAGLRGQGYLSASARGGAADPGGFVRVAATDDSTVLTDEKGTCYVALSRSGTGEIFVTSDTRRDPQLLTPLAQEACVIPSVLRSAAGSVGGFSAAYIPGIPTGLATGTVTSASASFNWNAVGDATGYRTEYRINAGAWTVLADNQESAAAVVPAAGNSTVEFRVASRNAAGVSAPTQAMSVVLPAANIYTWTSAAAPITGYAGMVTNADGTLRLRASGNILHLSKDGGLTWPQTAGMYMAGYSWFNPEILCNGTAMTAWKGYSGGANDEWGSRNAGSSWQDYGVGVPCSIPQVKSTDGKWKIWTSETATYNSGFYNSYNTIISFAGSAGSKSKSITNGYMGYSQRVRSVAVGEDGLHAAYLTTSNAIVRTIDGGLTWTSPNPGSGTTFMAMAKDAKRFAAIRGGQLYTTIDAGTTWKLETSAGTGLNWTGFSADGKTLTTEKNGTRYTGAFG